MLDDITSTTLCVLVSVVVITEVIISGTGRGVELVGGVKLEVIMATAEEEERVLEEVGTGMTSSVGDCSVASGLRITIPVYMYGDNIEYTEHEYADYVK